MNQEFYSDFTINVTFTMSFWTRVKLLFGGALVFNGRYKIDASLPREHQVQVMVQPSLVAVLPGGYSCLTINSFVPKLLR